MKQKIVIKVAMTCDKCRSKAMALVAAASGVDSVQLAGDCKDQLVVVGDCVDSIELTCALRKKVGRAHLVQVTDATKKEDEKKKEDGKKKEEKPNKPDEYPWPCPYPYPPIRVVYEPELDNAYACSIQ